MFEKDSGLDIETDVSGGESGGGGGGGDTLVSTTGSVHTVFPLLGSTMNARPGGVYVSVRLRAPARIGVQLSIGSSA